ncbi:MAG TPA: sugar phosphate isomerase/epimerase [Limnochordia bacterium]|nr:sugar phosphate isomerase/epimerase [Limnochordia bacterium]
MEIGIVTNGFGQLTGEELAARFADDGFKQIQLFFSQKDFPAWRYNGRPQAEVWSRAKADQTIGVYRRRGLEVLSLGVYTNMMEPDAAELDANLRHFSEMIEIAAANGVPMVATECGFIPGRRGLVRETFEADWARLVNSFKRVCEAAERHGVVVALEPCFHDLVNSAKRTRSVIEQVGSNAFKAQIDPGNLVTVNTEAEMFDHLADVTCALHGKDRKVNAAMGCKVGDGDVDWDAFFRQALARTPGVPLFMEYVNIDTYLGARDFLRERLTAAAQ